LGHEFLLCVEEKVAKATRVAALDEEEKKILVKLKLCGQLVQQLPRSIDKLVEYWGHLLVGLASVSRSLVKHVSESTPLLVDEREESNERARMLIQDQLDQRCNLRCSVPTVAAMCHHRRSMRFQQVGHFDRPLDQQRLQLHPSRLIDAFEPFRI